MRHALPKTHDLRAAVSFDVRRTVETIATAKGLTAADYVRSAVDSQLAADKRVAAIMALPEAQGNRRELARLLALRPELDVWEAREILIAAGGVKQNDHGETAQ